MPKSAPAPASLPVQHAHAAGIDALGLRRCAPRRVRHREGIDELHDLTPASELGTDFTKWPTVKHFSAWRAGLRKHPETPQADASRRGLHEA